MKTIYYFDDEEEGPARETSHPRFVELAPEDFYYDCTDDFSPFGSDDGYDTLAGLEEWYRDHGKKKPVVSAFLEELLDDWDFGLPDKLIRADAQVITEWLDEDKMHETYLHSECRARVATAFGQLKIAGQVDADILDEALAALRCQLWLNQRARIHYPQWQYADQELSRLTQMQSVLKQL
ncbi:MolR family transcriptional regulator [Undibacterium sp. TC4M20W]|uniref:MolR family transcriptional regulator n=1 Tax=Undibacterium sp. TC4M20W TaxID=3413052 RepID=UPI003BF07B87